MSAISYFRAFRFSSVRLSASLFLFAALGAPPFIAARSPQSTDPPPARQSQDPAKKDPAPATPVSAAAAAKAHAPKAHRVFTNDDFSSSSELPVAPGARRRLKQLNRCDRTCFVEVEKQALSWGYSSAFPRSTRQDMEDRLAGDIEDLQNDPKWQRLLLEMTSAHIDSCLVRRPASPPDAEPSDTPASDEEERLKDYKPRSTNNFNGASSAVLAYRFSSDPDPLKASLMVHQYMDEIHRDCSAVLPSSANSGTDDNEDP